MRLWTGIVALLALSISSANADEPKVAPKGPPPMILTAEVGKEGDQVTFTKCAFLLNQVMKDGKQVWESTSNSVTSKPKKIGKDFGSDVRAFNVDGKVIEPAELAKLSAKPRPVVVYYASPANLKGNPDSYYRKLFNEGIVFFEIVCDPFEVVGTPQPKPAPVPPKK